MVPAIRVENLAKSYRISHTAERGGYKTLRESMSGMARKALTSTKLGAGRHEAASRDTTEEFWALKDVSFDVQPGEVVGIIGRNGAGKSTLLKILSRITKPTKGQITLNGRIGSLLEVGTGFHPELTGRENVYLNGSIIGMRRREIDRRFDEIVEFSGVERFLDTPVKRYSSGMYVRLAFAVAAHLEPEILLVDEVLAVGDQAFQKKCIGRMSEIAAGGRTVILVSHNLTMLSNMSSRAIWINSGQVKQSGDPAEIVSAYCKQVAASVHETSSVSLLDHPGRAPHSTPLFQRATLLDEDENPTSSVPLGGDVTIELEVQCPKRADTGVVLDICDEFGTILARANSRVQSHIDFGAQSCRLVRCRLQNLRLLPGSYMLNLGLGDGNSYQDRIESALRFSIEPADIYGTGHVPSARNGLFAVETRWEAFPASRGELIASA